jgi:hypothetical protein
MCIVFVSSTVGRKCLMSIVQSRKNVMKLGGSWITICDGCQKEAPKGGIEAGDASFEARKAGFKTVGATARYPAKWLCPVCATKQDKTKNGAASSV